ncbi:MAG: DEAD/DEAH box helicase [Chitinophagaceae bacterium]|nr:DEAD/DEAH box helicase [Chitinophagaceae bacterium]
MTTFQELGLQEDLLQAITEMGFTTPTEIQQKAIPVFLNRESDLVALAQTGTGKTAAFGLPILNNLDLNNKNTQALIISPTRELCMQITNDLKNYSKYLRGVRITAVYGGSSIMAQMKDIRQGAHIIVATPGRLIDLIDRKAVKLDSIDTVVLDEADEMLNMGFQEDMETILAQTPDTKVTGLFSATMPTAIRSIAKRYLKESVEVSAGKKNAASTDITHQYAVVHAKDKLAALKRIIDFNEDFFGIIFCTTRIETQDISDALIKAGYNADCLHGDLSQQQRDKVMGKFRKRTIRILCATDVAARGIDVNDITHVIHYHLPDDIENYTHRSGRTARAGKKGISIALLHIREAYKLHQIEKMAGVKFEKFLIPRGEQIIAKRIQNYIQAFCEFDYKNDADVVLLSEWTSPLLQMDKEELVNRLLARELGKIDTSYTVQADLNVDEQSKSSRGSDRSSSRDRFSKDRNDRGDRRDRGDRSEGFSRRDKFSSNENTVRLFINLGKKDNMRYDEMRELIFQNTKVSGHNIKDIEMKGVYSFFETDEQSASRIQDGFKNVEAFGREVRVQRADEQKLGDEGFSETRERKPYARKEFGSGKSSSGYSGSKSGSGYSSNKPSTGFGASRSASGSYAKKSDFGKKTGFAKKADFPTKAKKKKDDLSW